MYSGADGRLLSRSESESTRDFGRATLAPHTFPSSYKYSRNARSSGPGTPAITYVGVKRIAEKGGLETHAIQVLNEPHQILALQGLNSISILVPAEEAAELSVKLW